MKKLNARQEPPSKGIQFNGGELVQALSQAKQDLCQSNEVSAEATYQTFANKFGATMGFTDLPNFNKMCENFFYAFMKDEGIPEDHWPKMDDTIRLLVSDTIFHEMCRPNVDLTLVVQIASTAFNSQQFNTWLAEVKEGFEALTEQGGEAFAKEVVKTMKQTICYKQSEGFMVQHMPLLVKLTQSGMYAAVSELSNQSVDEVLQLAYDKLPGGEGSGHAEIDISSQEWAESVVSKVCVRDDEESQRHILEFLVTVFTQG